MSIADLSRAAQVAETIARDFYNGRFDLSTRNGAPAATWQDMPEVRYAADLRAAGATDQQIRLFLTFTAAMERARDSEQLWRSACDLFGSNPKLFDPATAAEMPFSVLKDRLSQSGVSQRHEPDSSAWQTIARSLAEGDNPVRRVVDTGRGNAVELSLHLQTAASGAQPRFPLLKGPKIGPMWMRMLVAPGGAHIDNLDIVPVAVDVHVQRATANLISPDIRGASVGQARLVIHYIWRKAIESGRADGMPKLPSGLSGSAMLDPALWFFGKWGCGHCEGARRQIPISDACQSCQFDRVDS